MAEAQAVGLYPNENQEPDPYFEGQQSKVALEQVMQDYQVTVGKALDVPPEDVNVGNLFYPANMKPVPHTSGDLPPHLKNKTTATSAPYSSVIYKTISGYKKNAAGINIPQYVYFGQGSQMHQSVIDKNQPHTLIKNNWLPQGQNENGERLWGGIVVDNYGNIFKHTAKTQNQVLDIMYGWNTGLEDRLNWGIDTNKHIKGFSSEKSPIEFFEEDYLEDDLMVGGRQQGKKVHNGAPYWIENSWLGNMIVPNKKRSHFRFKPNALGVMTEYATPVGDMMAGATLAKIGQFTADVIPVVLDAESRALGSLYQFSAEQYYKYTNSWNLFQNKVGVTIKDGRPVPVFNSGDEAMKQHAFLWQTAKDAGADMEKFEKENPWPKTAIYETSRTYSDLVTPYYSHNIVTELLIPDSDISDQLLGKYIIPKDEFKKIITGEAQAASVKYPQEMLAFMASYKFFDRVIGRIAGTGSPRGAKIWDISKKNGEDIFNADPIRKGQSWKDAKDHVKEVYYKQGFHKYLQGNAKKDYPKMTSWLDKGRVAAHLNMKLYDNVNMLTSNTMAVGGLYFSDLFAGGNAMSNYVGLNYAENRQPMVPYILGSILVGLPIGAGVSSAAFQSGIMQQSFKPLQLMSYPKTGIKLATTVLSGGPAVYDLLKSTVKRTGNSYSPLDMTISELAAMIPDELVSGGRSVAIDSASKTKMAKFIIAARNNAVETGGIERFIAEIEIGEQFIDDLKQVIGADGKGGTYGVEFAEKYQTVLTDLDSLIGLKTLDNIVAETTNIGFNVNPTVIGETGKILTQARENAINLIQVVDDLIKISPQAEGVAVKSVADHLKKIRIMAETELKLNGDKITEYKEILQLNRELLTSEHYTGKLDNNRMLFKLLEPEVEINEATGVDPKITAKLIQETREKANKNLVSVIHQIKSNSDEFKPEDAAALFVEIDEAHTETLRKYSKVLYEEAENKLKVPADLGSMYTTLRRSFFDVDPAEGGIRPKDAARISDIIGEAVDIQYNGILNKMYPDDEAQIAQITQEVLEITGLKSLRTAKDYTQFYGILKSGSTQGRELRDFLGEFAPAMVNPKDDFKIPATSLLAVHKILKASHRSLTDKKSPDFLAYEKAINTLHKEIDRTNPDALETIIAAGNNYADNVHISKTGEFSTELASYTGRDSRVKNFERSTFNPTNKMYNKILPSKWLDHITDLILKGEVEQAATMLNDRFGQLTTRPRSDAATIGDNSLAQANIVDVAEEAGSRKIVSPEVAPLLSALLDWNLSNRLYHNPKTKAMLENIKSGEYADIAIEGTGIFGGKAQKGRASAEIDIDEFINMANNIELFNREMRLTEGTFYEVLDPINTKIGVFQPVTNEMANTRFLNSNTLDSLNSMVRTIIKNDKSAKAAYDKYENIVITADKKAVRYYDKQLNQTEKTIKEFTDFYNATTVGVGQKSLPFNFNSAYEFLTAEGGRGIQAFINGSKDPVRAKELVRRIIEEGYRRKTSVKIIGDKGSFTTAYPIPSTGETKIRTDFVTLPLQDMMVNEMDRIPNILTNKEYGIFSSLEHMEQVRRINLKINNISSKDLGLTDADWSKAAMTKVNLSDIPPDRMNANMLTANFLSFARRVVSPWYIGAVAWVRDLRAKNLEMFLAMARSPEVTNLMHETLFNPKAGKSLSRSTWQGAVGQKAVAASSNHWVDNEINYQIEMKSPLSYVGVGERVKDLDSVENIVEEGLVIQEQLDEIFPDINPKR